MDFQGAAKALVRDWKTGRFAHYTLPHPTAPDSSSQTTSKLPSLSSLFGRSDERILSELLSRKDLRKKKNGLVQLKDAVVDERRVDLEATVDLMDEDSSDDDTLPANKSRSDEMDSAEDDEESDDDEASVEGDDDHDSDELESGSDDDDSEDDEEEVTPPPVVLPKLSGKKGRETLRSQRVVGKESSKPKKSVSFAPYTKAGKKVKPNKAAEPTKRPKSVASKSVPSSRSANSSKTVNQKSTSKAPKSNDSAVQDGGGDAYDFSKYF